MQHINRTAWYTALVAALGLLGTGCAGLQGRTAAQSDDDFYQRALRVCQGGKSCMLSLQQQRQACWQQADPTSLQSGSGEAFATRYFDCFRDDAGERLFQLAPDLAEVRDERLLGKVIAEAGEVAQLMAQGDAEAVLARLPAPAWQWAQQQPEQLSRFKAGYAQAAERYYFVRRPDRILAIGEQLFATVPYISKLPEAGVRQRSFLLAWSGDGGQRWWFMDGSNLNDATVAGLFTGYESGLVYPVRRWEIL